MCGIAGIYSRVPDSAAIPRVAAMTQRLFHRGPDDGGLVAFDEEGSPRTVTLGHQNEMPNLPAAAARVAIGARRLAILDLSPRGRQPMCSADGTAWIVYNGEIYNHVELRGELSAAGCSFNSRSDTEVVLAAFLTWGRACFDRFDGMWAVALYQPTLRRLTLSRDRFGIKPLYYTHTASGFAFASEIKSLLLLPDQPRAINYARMADFLADGLLDHTSETMYAGIFSMAAGACADIDLQSNGDVVMTHHAALLSAPMLASDDDDTFESAAIRLRNAVDQSVRYQLRSDVPVGSCLSGGIDSAGIVASVAAIRAEDAASESQHTFTAVLPGDALDESDHARRVIDAVPNIQSHFVEPTPQRLLNDLPRLLFHQDEPFGSPSIYMQWEVMRAARAAGVSVLLDGQGADELFCGYPGYLPVYFAECVRRLHWRCAAAIAGSPCTRHHYSRTALWRHAAAQWMPSKRVSRLRRRRRKWLGEALMGVEDATSPMPPSGFPAYWWNVLTRTSLPGLLHYEDRNSMAFSVEARVPYLGQATWQAALATPAEMKLRGGWTKAILRKAMRGRVPDAILDRRDKIGFAAPTLAWMQGPLKPWWREQLGDARVRQRGWLGPAELPLLISRLERGDAASALQLWRAALAEQWASQPPDFGVPRLS